MSLYVFNNQQTVIKVIKYKRLIEGTQIQELNGTDELTVEIPNKDWDALEEEPLYLAIRDVEKRFSFHMYKIIQEDVNSDSVTVSGIQIGYDEMKAYGYIKDRRFTQASMQNVANAIVDGTDWQVGFVDSDLAAISTNFYYTSRLEAIRKVIEANGCEIRFRVEITGNRIVSKRIDFLKRMSSDKGKRFSYGSKLLSVVKEKDSAELYTALVGRGKGEEVGDGYGRRIGFEGVEWSMANGNPVDKPLGQEFVELPEMTALYGFPDGEPRTNVVVFEDTEDEALLLEQTYEKLVEVSRPQVQFKATVQLIGDAELGETVSIIRHDLNFKYKTRIFKVKRDLLNNNRTEIELGDRITESLGRTIRRIDTTNQRREERIVQYVQNTADGKNKIFRQAETPTDGMAVNDLWYKPVGDGEMEMYQWNGTIWELVVSTGINSEVNQRLDEAKDIAETARDNTHLLQLDADSILAGLGLEGIGETNQTIVNQIKANVGDRIDDLLETKVSENSIQYQSLIERYDLYERVIGSTENDVESNVTRIVQSSNIIQMEVRQSIGDFPNIFPNDTANDMPGGGIEYRYATEKLKANTPYRIVISTIEDTLVDLEVEGQRDLTFIYSENGRNFFETVATVRTSIDEIELINHDSWPLRSIKIESVKEINPNSLIGQIANVSTQVTQLADSWALTLKENDDVVAAINATSSGVYITGKNIILDGDTIVDGSFTVTDTIFAENMDISKFTVGTLNAANVNLINVNVDSLVGNTASFIRTNFNSASGNSLVLDANGIISTSNLYSYRLGSLGVEYSASGIETGIIRSYFDSTNSYSGRTRGIVAMARRGHEFHIGYDNTSAGGNYLPAIAVDGTTGRIYMDNIYPLRSMSHGLEFKSGSVGSQQGWFLQHTNSNRAGMFMANNGHVFVRRADGSYWNLSTWEYA